MALEAIVEDPENCDKTKDVKLAATTAATQAAVRVEQSHCSVAEDVQAMLAASSMEERGVTELLRTLRVTEIPEYYIKPEHMRQHLASDSPGRNTEARENQIPVVDLASSREELTTAIANACRWGFFQIVNHGVNLSLLRKLAIEADQFFALPLEDKIHCTTAAKVYGPIHFGGGSNGDWRDVLKISCAPASAVVMDHWPLQPLGFRETLVAYATQQQVLVKMLLEIISESLGLDKGYIEAECKEPRVVLALNHYPPCPNPSLTMGIREHSDPCTITVLLQDEVVGLQVQKDGMWVDVQSLEGALVVNVGDHLEILSNERYSSCLHRAVNNKSRPRTSVALFFSPSLTAHIQPAPALIDEKHPAHYGNFMYGDFLKYFYHNGGPNKKAALSRFQAK